ncbi:DUF1540 domain-containing protein [Clostridium beijerinckii]|uniref:DUF1540 domain-containing protein n=1 Tax=Clostridium beijerinckii TaxID=1520 RepID=UPI00222758E0|nr:DUF1540 domain-containing protein [Clostridium beijerinckii]UYZ37242.1 DUF1540 domain-containing protein [Clostridium beijerinckii]
MPIKCDTKTCISYKDGECILDTIEIKNFTWYDEEEREEKDKPACATYQYDHDWMYKRV